MKKIKVAFTMVEILICLTIIGIILAMSVQAIKTVKDSYTSLAYFAFNNVKTIVKSMREVNTQSPLICDNCPAASQEKDEDDLIVNKCLLANGTLWSMGILKPDYEGDLACAGTSCTATGVNFRASNGIPYCSFTTAQPTNTLQNQTLTNADDDFNFARRVAAMANTSGAINADADDLFNVAINTTDYGYNTPYIRNPNGAAFTSSNPTFTATNGQQYYITKRYYDARISLNFGFRLIAIDLNGTRNPNQISPTNNGNETTGRVIPDIITFLVLDNGFVYPLGVAADNKKTDPANTKIISYISSRIKAYSYGTPPGSTEDTQCLVSSGNTEEAAKRGIKGDCTFSVQYLSTPRHIDNNNVEVGDYRSRFCRSGQDGIQTDFYDQYCTNSGTRIPVVTGCPTSGTNTYDECYVEPIKPAFRYNL